MTLLELLKEHLKEWPEGVRCFSQDDCGSINENTLDKPAPVRAANFLSGGWTWPHQEWLFREDPSADDFVFSLPLAEDATTAIVTREMWEAA